MADLINSIQTDDQKAVEVNGHLMQAKNLNNITSESSDRKKCQDHFESCPSWKDDCVADKDWMKLWCPKTCGCSEEGTLVHNLDTFYLINPPFNLHPD